MDNEYVEITIDDILRKALAQGSGVTIRFIRDGNALMCKLDDIVVTVGTDGTMTGRMSQWEDGGQGH